MIYQRLSAICPSVDFVLHRQLPPQALSDCLVAYGPLFGAFCSVAFGRLELSPRMMHSCGWYQYLRRALS